MKKLKETTYSAPPPLCIFPQATMQMGCKIMGDLYFDIVSVSCEKQTFENKLQHLFTAIYLSMQDIALIFIN